MDVWVHLGRIFPSLNKEVTRSCAAMPETGESISDYISYSGIRACQASTGSMPKQQAISRFILHSATLSIFLYLSSQSEQFQHELKVYSISEKVMQKDSLSINTDLDLWS